MCHAVSDGTQKVYARAIDSFQNFRAEMEVFDIWPIPLDHVVQYIAYLSMKGYSHSSATTHISGLNFYHKLCGFQDLYQSFLVGKMLKGFKRVSTKGGDHRLPISIEVLKKINSILPVICSSKYEAVLFRSAFTLAFFGLFRVSEITTSCQGRYIKQRHTVQKENVILTNDSVQILLLSSKTDQFGLGSTITISKWADSDVCPVRNLQNLLCMRPKVGGPLFCHFGGDPLTRYQFASMLRKSLVVLGIPNVDYFSTHSFRIGGATHCAMLGYSNEQIQIMGRWKSNAFKSYIRNNSVN